MTIEIIGYSKRFGNKLILSVPTLCLPLGVYWLKGENGAGKTTLLKSVAGLIPFDGDIVVDGISICKKTSVYKRIVNYAEAEPDYPDFLTGDDLINFYVKAKQGTSEQVKFLSDTFEINEYKNSKIATYSSGMIKKLSLMLAFLGQPKLILLDEPLITLDVIALSKLMGLIKTYNDAGVGFLITSHQDIILPIRKVNCLAVVNNSIAQL